MPGLKEVRTRIASVKSTQQITSAMKMVSASKLKKTQNAILKMRPYAGKLKEILENLSASLDSTDGIFSAERKIQKALIVVVTSNRGLCGAFNGNVIKRTISLIHSEYNEVYKNGNLAILCNWKKGAEFLIKKKYNVIETNTDLLNTLSFENSVLFSERLMKYFLNGVYDKIEVVYNQFKNAAVQNLTNEQFLPIVKSNISISNKKQPTEYIFEPSKEQILSELIPKSLKIQFYKILVDTLAAEHGARMTAMHKATDNADNLLKDLRLSYNKARQASITKEILEIVGGAEALKG